MTDYTLYVDGGGQLDSPTYFSYLCFELPEIKAERIYLADLTELPADCSIFDNKSRETNNIAEYAALFHGIKHFREYTNKSPVTIYQDSELIVNQVNTELDIFNADKIYRCKQAHLRCWLEAVKSIWYPGVTLKWIERKVIVKVLGH